MRKSLLLITLLAVGLFAATAPAASTWLGTTTDWHTDTNWSPTGVPGSSTDWNFSTTYGTTYTLDLNGNPAYFHNLYENHGNTKVTQTYNSTGGPATLHFNSINHRSNGNVIYNVNLDGGTFETTRKNNPITFNGSLTLSELAKGPGASTSWNLYGGAAFNGGLQVEWFETYVADNSPHVNLHSAAVTVGGPGLTVGDHGIVTIYDDGASLATNDLTLVPLLTTNSSYQNKPVTGDGILDNQSSTPVTVSGTFRGSGTLWTGAIELLGTGTVAPGQSVGKLEGDPAASSLIVDDGATYDWEIGDADGTEPGEDWDLISASDIGFGGTWTLNIDDSGMVGTADPGEQFVIAQATNGFTGFNAGNVTIAGWDNASVLVDGNDLVLAVGSDQAGDDIPEPATMALLGLAAAGLGGYVRKRRLQ